MDALESRVRRRLGLASAEKAAETTSGAGRNR